MRWIILGLLTMRTISAFILFVFITAASAQFVPNGLISSFSSSHGAPAPPVLSTYYLSPTGNDSNPGTLASPWLSPNHSVNCGDVLIRAAGTYDEANFGLGKWGTVSNCPSSSGIYFAQLQCAGPYVKSCVINAVVGTALFIDKSNWAVIGAYNTSATYACFVGGGAAQLPPPSVHHVAFINVIADGCGDNGLVIWFADYVAVVGAITRDSAKQTMYCTAGLAIEWPINLDELAGTHVFVAGVFAFDNIATMCDGGTPTDSEGLFLNDWGNNQVQRPGGPYTGQGVLEQNISVGNGGYGLALFSITGCNGVDGFCTPGGYSGVGSCPFVFGNTFWGNFQNATMALPGNPGELFLQASTCATVHNNLAQATVAGISPFAAGTEVQGCGIESVSYTYVGIDFSGNYCFGVMGQDEATDVGSFSNTLADPMFTSPASPVTVPTACATSALVTTCMAATIANFVPLAAGAIGKGYQPPGACTPDSFFPVWLKGVVPDGLITKPCGM